MTLASAAGTTSAASGSSHLLIRQEGTPLITEIVAPVASLAGGALGAGLTGWFSRRTAQAQSKAAAELAARSPRKQAYADFIHVVRRLVHELQGLLPDIEDEIRNDDVEEFGPHGGSVRHVCEAHLPSIDTASAVIRLEGPAEAAEAATAVVDAVNDLWSSATEMDIGGVMVGCRSGFTDDVREALNQFADTCSGILNRST